MKKKTDKELGYIITDGMIDTIGNSDLSDAQVGMFVRSIVGGNRDYAKGDMIVKALVTAFIDQFKAVNKRRSEMIGRRREGNRERERIRREESQLARERLEKINALCDNMSPHAQTCDNMSAHVRTCGVIKGSKYNNNTPIIPLAGDKKSSSAKADARTGKRSTKDHAHTGEATTTTRPSTGGPSQRPKGALAPSARPTAQSRTSGDSRERAATSSKKIGGAKAGGLWDGAAVVVNAAERMAERHPNSKSGKRAVVRALAAAIEDEAGDRPPPEIVEDIERVHAAWCQTDGWSADKGQFVQALAAWIRNGGWRKLPPEKKKTPPPKGDEMSFGASL